MRSNSKQVNLFMMHSQMNKIHLRVYKTFTMKMQPYIGKNEHRQVVEVKTDKTVIDQICDTDKAGNSFKKNCIVKIVK